MPLPTYGGLAIFGTNIRMMTVTNPRYKQINEFFGVSGQESLDGGLRGRYTLVRGRLYGGASPINLGLQEFAFMNLQDNQARELDDNLGRIWLNVLLESFEPADDRVRWSPTLGYTRRYSARLFHLS